MKIRFDIEVTPNLMTNEQATELTGHFRRGLEFVRKTGAPFNGDRRASPGRAAFTLTIEP